MKKFRLNAGVVVFRKDGKVLSCQRVEGNDKNWQFPQGGIDNGETSEQAALRELYEETSVLSVEHVASLPEALRYEFPLYVKQKNIARGIFNDGQEQYWHLFYFTGNDTEINLDTIDKEFKSYRWINIEESLNDVVDFKYDIYKKVVAYFSPIIEKYISQL